MLSFNEKQGHICKDRLCRLCSTVILGATGPYELWTVSVVISRNHNGWKYIRNIMPRRRYFFKLKLFVRIHSSNPGMFKRKQLSITHENVTIPCIAPFTDPSITDPTSLRLPMRQLQWWEQRDMFYRLAAHKDKKTMAGRSSNWAEPNP